MIKATKQHLLLLLSLIIKGWLVMQLRIKLLLTHKTLSLVISIIHLSTPLYIYYYYRIAILALLVSHAHTTNEGYFYKIT